MFYNYFVLTEYDDFTDEQISKKKLYPDNSNQLMTIADLANYLNCSKQKIYQLTSNRKIPFRKLGNQIMFKKVEIDNWIDEQKIEVFKPMLKAKNF